MKYVPLLVGGFTLATLAACGVNAVPEVSDIKESLNAQFGGCKYVKVSDIKKINGRDVGNGRYLVEQEFTFEILPEDQFEGEYKKIMAVNAEIKQIEQDLKAKFDAKKQALKAEGEKLNNELNALNKDNFDSVDSYVAARNDYLNRIYANNTEYHDASAHYVAELNQAFVAAGYSNNAYADRDKRFNELHQKVIAQFDGTCSNMTARGKTMVLETAGLSPGKQVEAMVKGAKSQYKGTSTYTKTENGWVL